MKAIVLNSFGSANNFALADLPIPELREGELRVRIKAVSFNPVDYQIRKGQPESRLLQSMILGRDLAGSVDAVHESVSEFVVGDEVYGYVCNLANSGTYVEYICVPAELLAKKPNSLTLEQASAVPVAGITATIALNKVAADKTKSLFIAGGAGGVGTFALLLARRLGVQNLMTTAGNAKSRAYLINKCGMSDHQIVNYHDKDFIEQAIKLNGGRYDAVLDLVGGKMLSACCALLGLDGHLASITEAPSQDDFELLFQKNASFHAVGANAYSLPTDRIVWLKYRQMLNDLSQYFDSGALVPPPINILGGMSLEVVKQAHALLENYAVQGKLVMTC
jgi:NADPH:quinone reductase